MSLFTPQPMTADNIAVSQASGQTVCAGDTGQPLLRVNIHTSNTEPPLKAGTFAFNANGTHATIKPRRYTTPGPTRLSRQRMRWAAPR